MRVEDEEFVGCKVVLVVTAEAGVAAGKGLLLLRLLVAVVTWLGKEAMLRHVDVAGDDAVQTMGASDLATMFNRIEAHFDCVHIHPYPDDQEVACCSPVLSSQARNQDGEMSLKQVHDRYKEVQ